MARSIVKLRTRVHRIVGELMRQYYNRFWGMNIGEGTRISLKARLDKTHPKGITIGSYTMITFDVAILTHDFIDRTNHDVRIGSCCFIGRGATILPGVTIGDHCIVGAGSIVRDDVPSNSVVVGNPARIVQSGIETMEWGMRPLHRPAKQRKRAASASS